VLQVALVRIRHQAMQNTIQAAADTVETIYNLAGAPSVYRDHPFKRSLRDLHTAKQHLARSEDMHNTDPESKERSGAEAGAWTDSSRSVVCLATIDSDLPHPSVRKMVEAELTSGMVRYGLP
jgi:hypothetical protein